MDKKIEYISKLLKKMNGKGIETYIISRIWHLLNNDEIKMVPQQYVRHANGQYSLTDLYFPQFNLHVEVNEPGHYQNDERIISDIIREQKIVGASKHQIMTVDCGKDTSEIHEQVDSVIDVIRSAALLQVKSETFKPWEPELEYKASSYKDQSVLRTSGNIALETIEQICELFQVPVPRMGFLRKGAVSFPKMENTIIWWPSSDNKNWFNTISPEGRTITEKANKEKVPGLHAAGVLANPHRRITFFKDRDVLGYTYYRFKGVFELDLAQSSLNDGLSWSKISDEVSLL